MSDQLQIATTLLAAMLDGACTRSVNPLYMKEFKEGIINSPNIAWNLAGELIKLDNTKKDEND